MQQENMCCYKKSMSCRKVVMRHLRVFVSDGMANGRKEIRRSRIKCGMTPNLMGFTLIELLVVVLIIGILAAVALPQYQQAVDKSRVMPYIQLVKEILKAENLYFTANGEYTSDLQALDIDVSKACPVQFGGELRNCAGGFAFNIPSQHNTIVNNAISLYYCRDTESCNYNENRHFVAVFPFNGFTPACSHNTSRGKHLCTWITSQF